MLACFLSPRARILKAIPDCPNARHVEALMLAEHGELNWWSQHAFAEAARAAAARAAADPVNAERVAQATIDQQAVSHRRRPILIPCLIILMVLAGGAVFEAITFGYEDRLTPFQDFASWLIPASSPTP